MRTLILFVCASFITIATNAQSERTNFKLLAYQPHSMNSFSLTSQASNKSSLVMKDEKHWKKLRTAGIILTSFGAACVAGGIVFIAEDKRINGSGSEGFGVAIGSAGIIGGAMAIGGGIAMLTIGNRHLKKLRNASISTSENGLGLALHF